MSDTLIEKQKELENIRKHRLRGQIIRAREQSGLRKEKSLLHIYVPLKPETLHLSKYQK